MTLEPVSGLLLSVWQNLNQLNYSLTVMQKSLLNKQQVLDSFSLTSEVSYMNQPPDRSVYTITGG